MNLPVFRLFTAERFARPSRWVLAGCLGCFLPLACSGLPVAATFDQPIASQEWNLQQINPDLPSDWTPYEYLVLEFRASSSQRFELGLRTPDKLILKRIHPYPNVWARASIPLRFYREGLGEGRDMAATVNKPRDSCWICVEGGGHGPTNDVRGMAVVMRYPVGRPRLEIRSVTLARTDPGDDVLEGGKPLIDEFGQYVHADWPEKAKSEADLQRAWQAEAGELAQSALPDRCPYGGFAGKSATASGFFRVEKIDGRWWFVCPDGHLFFSTGVNGVGYNMETRVAGREELFVHLPPPIVLKSSGDSRPPSSGLASFYGANILRRYGPDWAPGWAETTARRFDAWGLNTCYSMEVNGLLGPGSRKKPYVQGVGRIDLGPRIMGMPDVYAEGFMSRVDALIAQQVSARRDDPYLLGTFIGNEPPWPRRESQFVDLILAGPLTAMQARFRAELAVEDTPQRRRGLVLAAFVRYLEAINGALRRHDPNHLNLGIRFGGGAPDYVLALCQAFDVLTFNMYVWEPPRHVIDRARAAADKPIIFGEFHIGVPGRGLAPGLVQAANQAERGQAYRYYVERAASHPEVIGTHWFQWIDQMATGRPDGENYNIGWVDVTDRPYREFLSAARLTHERLLEVHLGRVAPTDRMAVASEVGTPVEGNQFGLWEFLE